MVIKLRSTCLARRVTTKHDCKSAMWEGEHLHVIQTSLCQVQSAYTAGGYSDGEQHGQLDHHPEVAQEDTQTSFDR